jgi:hypothetical protein
MHRSARFEDLVMTLHKKQEPCSWCTHMRQTDRSSHDQSCLWRHTDQAALCQIGLVHRGGGVKVRDGTESGGVLSQRGLLLCSALLYV